MHNELTGHVYRGPPFPPVKFPPILYLFSKAGWWATPASNTMSKVGKCYSLEHRGDVHEDSKNMKKKIDMEFNETQRQVIDRSASKWMSLKRLRRCPRKDESIQLKYSDLIVAGVETDFVVISKKSRSWSPCGHACATFLGRLFSHHKHTALGNHNPSPGGFLQCKKG